jgi:hypothetical protein
MTSNVETEENNCENKTKSGFNSNSFERFGDDLCELLLRYLSISDKIHFECVSKQWQRLVFNKQQKLFITIFDPECNFIIYFFVKNLCLIKILSNLLKVINNYFSLFIKD